MGLKEQFLGKETNFHVVRHLAALGVIFNHSYILQTGSKAEQPLRSIFGISFGEISLDFFFLVSGYFIALSLQSRDHLGRFLAVRSARLHPALVLSLLLGCFVIAPLFGGMNFWELLVHPNVYVYLAKNTAMAFGMVFNLPGGVFQSNPFPGSVNGAIWTLALEARLILALGASWWLLRNVRNRVAVLSWLSLAIAGFCLIMATSLRVQGEFVHPGWRLHWMFLLGAWIRFTPLAIPAFRPAFLWLLLVCGLAGAFLGPKISVLAWPFFSPGLVFALSFVRIRAFKWFPRNVDYSYGLFVFAFPIQQSIVASGWTNSPGELFITAVAISLPIAALCWHFVEKPIASRVKKIID